MASETEVANLAAVRIGTAARITSLDDNATVARALKAVWDTERRAVLRDGSYNFATASRDLAARAASYAVPYPWTYAFPLPADALRLLEVQNLASRMDYQLEQGDILCDSAGPLYVRVVADMPEMGLWDAAAVEAFAIRLAWRIGPKIAGSAFDMQGCWQDYRMAIGRAKTVDAIENPPIAQEDGEWIEARLGIRRW